MTLKGIARLLASRDGLGLTFGLVLLLVYSRLIGMEALWHGLLDGQYLRVFKNAVEEVTELFGYALVMAASLHYLLRRVSTTRIDRSVARTLRLRFRPAKDRALPASTGHGLPARNPVAAQTYRAEHPPSFNRRSPC